MHLVAHPMGRVKRLGDKLLELAFADLWEDVTQQIPQRLAVHIGCWLANDSLAQSSPLSIHKWQQRCISPSAKETVGKPIAAAHSPR